MNITKVLNRSWEIIWKYKALWLFATVLAFTVGTGFFWIGLFDGDQQFWEDDQLWSNEIILSDSNKIIFPGEGLQIDLTDPARIQIYIEDGGEIIELQNLQQLVDEWVPGQIWTVIVIGLVWLGVLILVGIIARNVSRAALIGMVEQGESSGEIPGVGKGLRIGFSRFAWRLFAIDLLVFLFGFLVTILMLALVAAPLLLLATDNTVGKVIGIVTASGMFFAFVGLMILGGVFLSLFVEVIRRACVQDDLGVFAGIARGVKTVFSNFGSFAIIWLIWLGVRLGWTVAFIPVAIILTPVLLLTLLLGALVAIVPLLLTAGIAGLFLSSFWPWVVAGIVAFPFFIWIAFSPFAFVNGLVEIFKANLWTLSYRDLRPLEEKTPLESEVPPQKELPAAGVEPASIS